MADGQCLAEADVEVVQGQDEARKFGLLGLQLLEDSVGRAE